MTDFIEVYANVLSKGNCGYWHSEIYPQPNGSIPISSDKYVLTFWVLYNPAEKIYTV